MLFIPMYACMYVCMFVCTTQHTKTKSNPKQRTHPLFICYLVNVGRIRQVIKLYTLKQQQQQVKKTLRFYSQSNQSPVNDATTFLSKPKRKTFFDEFFHTLFLFLYHNDNLTETREKPQLNKGKFNKQKENTVKKTKPHAHTHTRTHPERYDEDTLPFILIASHRFPTVH